MASGLRQPSPTPSVPIQLLLSKLHKAIWLWIVEPPAGIDIMATNGKACGVFLCPKWDGLVDRAWMSEVPEALEEVRAREMMILPEQRPS